MQFGEEVVHSCVQRTTASVLVARLLADSDGSSSVGEIVSHLLASDVFTGMSAAFVQAELEGVCRTLQKFGFPVLVEGDWTDVSANISLCPFAHEEA